MEENNQPILSICIPTWNRRYSLQYTLKSIIDQDEFKSWDVEIVISDNASTDETEVEVWKLCKKYKNIRYFRNEENIWSSPNVNKVFSLWRWEYLRLLWSDSLINSWWIWNTLRVIKEKTPDIIYNTCSHVEKFKKLKNDYDSQLNVYTFKSTRDFLLYLWEQYNYDSNSFMHIEHLLTFISCICLSNEFYKNAIESIYRDYSEENFNKNYFSQELLCLFNNADNWIVLMCKDCINRFNIKKTSYFVNYWIVKDFNELCQFILNKYEICNKGFSKLIFKSKLFWYGYFIRWIIIKFLIKIKLYKSLLYIYRKYILKIYNSKE